MPNQWPPLPCYIVSIAVIVQMVITAVSFKVIFSIAYPACLGWHRLFLTLLYKYPGAQEPLQILLGGSQCRCCLHGPRLWSSLFITGLLFSVSGPSLWLFESAHLDPFHCRSLPSHGLHNMVVTVSSQSTKAI